MMRQTTLAAVAYLLWTGALLAQGGSPLDEQLLAALWDADCKSVAGFLKKGASPNARNEKVGTALMRASRFCQAPVVALLLDKGAELEARDENGWTPLLHAVDRDPPEGIHRQFQVEVVRLLLARKANTSVKDEDGSTAVHHAAQQRNPDVVKMLLAAGLPADTRNKDGATPLFLAVAQDRLQNVEILLDAGADPNAKNNSGSSVMNLAMSRGDSDVLHVLHERGAKRGPAPPGSREPASGPPDLTPIDGVTLAQWARANGRLTHGVPLERVIAGLKLTKARWEKANELWTERLTQHTLALGQEYAKHFRAAMDEEAARAGEPGTQGGSGEPIPFEKWIEVLEATYAASERVPALYEMSTGDWTRVNAWWGRKLDAKEVDKALYDRLSLKYEKQFAARPPASSGAVLRPGSLESNSEPVPFEKWVEMQKALEAAMDWTLKRQGLTLGQWIRANSWWGQKFNKALLGLDQATPAQRAETQKMHAERIRLSALYKKKFAEGVPW